MWTPFEDVKDEGVRNVSWSPDGSQIAFDALKDGARVLGIAPTQAYLQAVKNLHQFPELYGKGRSAKLDKQRFVARPGEQKEFHALYEQLRYQRRPQFVTADAALQAYRDELLRILQSAEERASDDLRKLSNKLYQHYGERLGKSPEDDYLASYFATAWVALEAAHALPMIDADGVESVQQDKVEGSEATRLKDMLKPPIERIPAVAKGLVAKLPEALRATVKARLQAMFAHAQIEDLTVPGREKPVRLDWTQFAVRGPYAESKLAGYFLAMTWYALAPLPLTPALIELSKAMETVKVKGKPAIEAWERVDALVAAFMGKPVDATLRHVQTLRKESAGMLEPFDVAKVTKQLEKLRGPMPLRDAEASEGRKKGKALSASFFPKRVGFDTTIFRAMTDSEPWPSALEPMAVLGSERALKHAIAAQLDEKRAVYEKTLRALVADKPKPGEGFYGTDIYHAWLATLVTLATANGVSSEEAQLRFARSDAWRDRLLSSALGGYTQLKHAATLYNMQDNSAECDGDVHYSVLIEQPLLPAPRGFVDPVPQFFDELAKLADRVYKELHDDKKGPASEFWAMESKAPLNARNFARDLAAIARVELSGKPLSDEQARFIEFVGARLESLALDGPARGKLPLAGEARAKRGVAIATDIHTNTTRRQVLEMAIGRILDLYVAVPSGVGQTMTQGGAFSFYQFEQDMAQRLTDAQWGDMLERGNVPPLPAWTASFIEDAPKDAKVKGEQKAERAPK